MDDEAHVQPAHGGRTAAQNAGLANDLEYSRVKTGDLEREIRRYEALIDTRWDEMQRLRDLVYAIATKQAPRAVVEREVAKLSGTVEPMPGMTGAARARMDNVHR